MLATVAPLFVFFLYLLIFVSLFVLPGNKRLEILAYNIYILEIPFFSSKRTKLGIPERFSCHNRALPEKATK